MKIIIKGNPISKIEEVRKFTPYDELIVSKVVKTVGSIPEETVKSYKITYEELSTKLVHDIKEALHLSSMAFRSTEEYSKTSHKHDYTKVKVYPYYRGSEYRTVGNISVDGTDYELKIPNFPTTSYDQSEIGDLKMIYTKTFSFLKRVGLYIDPSTEKFNGWVPADGKEYKRTDFPQAFEYFRKPTDTETFHVPTLSDFFCANYGNETEDERKLFPKQTGISSHIHQNIESFEGERKLEFYTTVQIPTTKSAGSDAYCHSGSGTKASGQVTQFSCDIDTTGENRIVFTSGQSEYTETEDETHPTYNLIPILVYIGEKNK